MLYLNIGDNRCARLNGPAFRNVICAVGYSDVSCTLFALTLHTLQRGLAAIAYLLVHVTYFVTYFWRLAAFRHSSWVL